MTVSGAADGAAPDLIGSGREDEPRLGWPARAALGVALVAVLGGAWLARSEPEPEPPAARDLQLVDTGGGYSLQWGYGGRLDISLPWHVRNDGPPVTVASLAVDGTSLAQPAVDVELSAGGRLPVTLRQSGGCAGGIVLPDDARLRLEVRQEGAPSTLTLPLPGAAVAGLTEVLEVQCAAVPLDQALVLTAEEEQVRGDEVLLRVQADNISDSAVQLLSVNPVTGLQVALADAAAFPLRLGAEPVPLRLTVRVASCAALVRGDREGAFSVADIGYDDGQGSAAVKTVRGDFEGVRRLLARSCSPGP